MEHMNNAFVFNNDEEFEELGGGLKRKVLAYGENLMMVEVHFEQDGVGAVHTHSHSQITYVLSGTFEFMVNGEYRVVHHGDTVYSGPNVPHGCRCLEKGVLLDSFNPYRKDFV